MELNGRRVYMYVRSKSEFAMARSPQREYTERRPNPRTNFCLSISWTPEGVGSDVKRIKAEPVFIHSSRDLIVIVSKHVRTLKRHATKLGFWDSLSTPRKTSMPQEPFRTLLRCARQRSYLHKSKFT
jgi:hypothetical protein